MSTVVRDPKAAEFEAFLDDYAGRGVEELVIVDQRGPAFDGWRSATTASTPMSSAAG